jgi:hypothetical protein
MVPEQALCQFVGAVKFCLSFIFIRSTASPWVRRLQLVAARSRGQNELARHMVRQAERFIWTTPIEHGRTVCGHGM